MSNNLSLIRQRLGFDPTKDDRLLEAMTHRSFAVEKNLQFDNQRLEFLGDAVLEIILTDYLFTLYPDADEGIMTKMRSALARESTLALLAKKLELGDTLLVGHGEAESGGGSRVSTLADLFEAVIGALYLNAGFETTKSVVTELFAADYPDPKKLLAVINPKGALQEYTQRRWGQTPVYQVLQVSGPDHDPDFKVQVVLKNYSATGSGNSRKAAESEAANSLLEHFHEIFPESEEK